MGFKDKMLSFVGLGKGRRLPPPHIVAIAPGLLITSTKAEAWFQLKTSNSDLHSEAESDAELTAVIRAAGKVLQGQDCHLKIVWGRTSGDAYLQDAASFYNTGDWQRWAEERAARIDELDLPERYVMLGITLDSERQNSAAAQVKDAAADTLGVGINHVSEREIAYYAGLARKVGRTLQASKLGAQTASSELIAWMQAREQRRGITAVPYAGTITGAGLSRITGGRVVPYTDHLRSYGAKGEITAYTSIITLSEFPDELETPGDGEWLLTLSGITRIDDTEGSEGAEVPVIADASVRFRVMSKKESLKRLDEARSQAKEQRKSAAKGSAGETTDEIQEAEGLLGEMMTTVKREGVYLIEHHPRIVVSATTPAELEANVEAVIAHYGDLGITATVAEDEQRDLWLEQLPGDELRVPDLGHIQTDVGFFGSWFWGGSRVGDSSHAPVIGYTTGSTISLTRFSAVGGGARRDATTTGVFGRSRRGKTTLVMLSELDAGFQGSWVTHLDFKAESAGVVHTAREYGLEGAVIRVGKEHSGAADLFNVFPREQAKLYVSRQLYLMAPKSMKLLAETATLAAATHIANHEEQPSTWAVIERLLKTDDKDVRALGEALKDLADTPLGAVVAGPPTGNRVLREEPGIWVVQLPNLVLPSAQSNPEDWDSSQRLGMAVMRAFMAHAMEVAARPALRTMPKLVAIPEVHRLLKTSDGGDFMDQIARMGGATHTNLILDSQDATGIAALEGVVEQLSTVFGFQLTTPTQQDALAELLNIGSRDMVNYDTRNLIREIGYTTDSEGEQTIRYGHAVYRDWKDQAATVQVDLPSQYVQEMLSTNPDATANVVDLEPEVEPEMEASA